MQFTYKCKKPIKKSNKFIENFFIKKDFGILVELSKKKKRLVNETIVSEPFIPEIDDLYNLYEYIKINKRINT